MTIKNALIVSDSPFFSGAHGHMREGDLNTLSDMIRHIANKGVFIEIEQIIDCVTHKFPRTSNRIFDIGIVHSKRPYMESWGELDISLEEKIKNDGKVLQYSGSNQVMDEYIGKSTRSSDGSSEVVDFLLAELESSVRDKNYLRAEMLVKLLMTIDASTLQAVIGISTEQSDPLTLCLRIQSIAEEAGIFDSYPMEEIESMLGLNGDIGIEKIAIFTSGITATEITESVKNSINRNDLSRELFLNSKNIFSSFFFLSISSQKNIRFNKNSIRDLIQNDWANDHDVLAHWTQIDPMNFDSWQIRTRALWNDKKRVECGEVAEEALTFHPGEHNLLRRMAHGLRERGNHSEAIAIELIILDEEGLSRIDNYIYLSRSYFALEDWENARNFTELALSIDPNHPEMLRKLDAIESKNY